MTPPILRTRKQMLRGMQPAPRDPIEAALSGVITMPDGRQATIRAFLRRLLTNDADPDVDPLPADALMQSMIRAAIAAYLREIAAQPINATEDMPMAAYTAANARKDWACRLAAELEYPWATAKSLTSAPPLS